MPTAGATADTGRDGWQLEESSAAAYERYLVPAIFADGAERLLQRTGVASGERVLDVCCGTGAVAREAARRVGPRGRVVGVDLNSGMLDVARAASRDVALAIEWREANVVALPFDAERFDVVACQQGLQFLPDRSAAIGELRRVLAPGGRAAFSVCAAIERCAGYPELAAALERHVGADAAAMMRSPFAAWTRAGLASLLEGAGFRDVRVSLDVVGVRYPSAAEFVRREAASSPLAAPVGALDAARRDALVGQLERALAERTDDDGVLLSLETWTAVGRRP